MSEKQTKCIEGCGRERQPNHWGEGELFPRCRPCDKLFEHDWVPCEGCGMPVSINGCSCTADEHQPPEGPLRAKIKLLEKHVRASLFTEDARGYTMDSIALAKTLGLDDE
jgi:hypothetical protein